MKRPKAYVIGIGIIVVFILIYGMTYVPRKIVTIKPGQVSRITVFDGNTGYQTEIADKEAIQHIVHNLNEITFQKGKWAFTYTGYSYKTTIYNNKGKAIKKLIINAANTVRYKGFFYRAKGQQIDYAYIKKLIETLPKQGP
ncbi:hypothetical protein GZH47_26685 [Paenibacillus rhizovicinus]|uniref:Uncharacterized protein n=1 Tax=Paenibacillus rhizovicinus TaxID=2704463 RepID=A0A6C0P6Q5_9BACL|nr:hypothetical protein [Paenibacillus rhizovicinus]QHW34026.1 hypothetical protein GZH47_26685 [Paenibacillus rhizovicinus]